MRVTRDQRGYETTFLLHSARPGERPLVLYWYRTAPGVRVGRRALDEDAIRTLEEQHPDIEFDWPTLLEEAESAPAEVERRPERPRRKRPGAEGTEDAEQKSPTAITTPPAPTSGAPVTSAPAPVVAATNASVPVTPVAGLAPAAPLRARNALLEQLVGREIAFRLRARYAEVSARLSELPDDEIRAAWQKRADALDPDRWDSAEAILAGIQHADRLFDDLKREFPVAE